MEDHQRYGRDERDQCGGRVVERVAVVVGRAVSALVATAHLTDIESVEFVRLDDRFVEAFRCVVVVNADG